MGKVYYISKNVGLGLLLLAAIALTTILALSIAYHKEKMKNQGASESSVPAAPTTAFTPKDPWDHYRLPDALVPVSYRLNLWPRLQPNEDGMYIFTGQSSVIFRCVKETDLIIIHASKLNFTTTDGHQAKLSGVGDARAPVIQKTFLVKRTEYLVIQLRRKLTAGATYLLETGFVGELADDLEGFYRSEYTQDGVKKVVATSQMQATYARQAFPCFDEPAMKAVFNVTIVHDPSYVALSNDISEVVIEGVRVKVTTFEPTERMSTYLLAFIVSDFDHVQSSQNNLLIRIWAKRTAIADSQGDYALSVTGPILQFFERYYNTTYPLSKSDQIALPDFSNGAMENWGLVTYRETALLFDPVLSSTGNKERVTTVISHELAHMWFGNLVTLKWWNDLWLNEGFASYVEYLGADYAEPTWNIKDQIILYDVHRVFAVDALASSHPLSRREDEVNDPAQISEMFNTISYSKVSSCGRERDSSSSYLNTFAFGNTVYTDLWDHLQQAVDNTPSLHIPRSIGEIMNRWTLQMGFPVVTIDTRTGSVTQKHFLLDPESVVDRPSQFNWNNALCASGSDWVLANTNVSGYFRVNYDLDNWDRLLTLLNTHHQVSQASLADCFLCAFSLQAYLKKQVQPLFEHFRTLTANWTRVPEGHTDKYNQINAIWIACSVGVEGCRELISSWFRQWMDNPGRNLIHPNLKGTVYCVAVAFGGAEEWDFAWRMFKNSTLASEALRLRAAMACTKVPWLLNRYLEYTLDPTKIRKQDATSTINLIAQNVVGMPLAWNFVRAKWSDIYELYGKSSFSFPNLVSGIATRFSTEFELQELKKFKEENQDVGFGSATMALEQAIEKTKANIKWVSENKAEVLRWFTEEST
uniref:Aminopeptidase n=1 Tax=Salarias fasciatus TaxID=181472 RepID=A0A672FHM4_SALFA